MSYAKALLGVASCILCASCDSSYKPVSGAYYIIDTGGDIVALQKLEPGNGYVPVIGPKVTGIAFTSDKIFVVRYPLQYYDGSGTMTTSLSNSSEFYIVNKNTGKIKGPISAKIFHGELASANAKISEVK